MQCRVMALMQSATGVRLGQDLLLAHFQPMQAGFERDVAEHGRRSGTHAAVPKVAVETWVRLCSMTRDSPKSASLHT